MSSQYALPTRCLSSNLKQAIISAARFQVAGVQVDVRQELSPDKMGATAIRDFRNRLQEMNLKVASGAFPMRQAIYEPQWLEQRLEALRSAMTFCYQLGTDVLTVRTGRLPDPENRSGEWQVLCEVLNEMARLGNHTGVTLCLSLSMESPERVRQLLKTVTEGQLGLNFDPLTVMAADHDLSVLFRDFHAEIKHVRARDGIRDINHEIEECPLGMGGVDWPQFLGLLQEADYRGWIVIDRTSGDDKVRDLSTGLSYLRQLLPF